MSNMVIGVDIGGTNFRIACVDQDGNFKNLFKYPSQILFETKDPINHTAELIGNYMDHFITGSVSAVSIGLPGEIANDRQTPLSMPNLRIDGLCFDGKNLVVPLQEALGVPVFINRDANNHLLCDIKLRNLYHQDVVVGIYFGTGVGCSAFIDDKFLCGKHGAAMVLGHIPFYKSPMQSHVGSYGCAETHASGYRLRQLWEEKFRQIEFKEIFTHCLHEPEIEDYIEAQANTVATVATLLDPALLVLGGGVLEMIDYPFDFLHQRIRSLCKKPYPASDLTIVPPIIRKHSGIVGAGFYAFDQLRRG